MSTNILYFTADWCNPCKKVRPIVEELNKDQIEIKFQIIDVDSEGELTRKFSVRSVPTFVRIEDGEETSRITGAQTREQLERFMRNE
jgi:thioredoxin 1